MTRLAHDLHGAALNSTRLDVLAPTSVHVGMTNVIGRTTTYVGDEIPGLRGQQVRIFGVMRAALLPNTDVAADDYFVTDDRAIQQHGGVTKHDRVDIAHLRADGSASFVHCDPRAIDLECFAHLRQPAAKNIPMNNKPNPERPPIEADHDADAALDNDYQDMSEQEFEGFLAIAVEGYADAVSALFAKISTFREAGVLTSNKGLLVRIGAGEFQITIVRSR